MMDALERKEHLDKEKKEMLKSLNKANSSLQRGTLENYAVEVKAKVQKYQEENKEYGGLTKEEYEEAKNLIDPN